MTNQVAVMQKDITDTVNGKLAELQQEGLVIPANFNASNALKLAFFKLQEVKDKSGNLALNACTKDSVANALLDMTIQGLSPTKTQCYFVVYGDKLQLNRSYFGTQAVLKRLSGVKDIWANVIYQDDVFDYENYRGRERLLSHKTAFENRDKPILGAYAVVLTADDEEILTVMTKAEIDTAWGQSDSKKWQKDASKQTVHDKFPQEMAKRTVINRAAKAFINTSDDNDALIEAINNTTENEYEPQTKDMGEIHEVQREIEQNANSEELDFGQPEQQIVEPEQVEPKTKVKNKPEPTIFDATTEDEPGF